MNKKLFKGNAAFSGEPKPLGALSEEDGIHPVEKLIENDEILRKYSEEAMTIVVEYHKEKMRAAREAAESEAGEIIAAAKSEATKIMAEAKGAAESLARDAAANARKAAEREAESVRTEARNEVVREFMSAISTLKAAAETLKARQSAHLQSLDIEMAKISGEIARRILARELAHDPSYIVSAVRASLEYFELGAKIVIKISPEHYKALTSRSDFKEKIEELGLGAERVEIVPDSAIKSGGVVVTDSFVEYDLNFDRIIDEAVGKAIKLLESGELAAEA